MRSNGERRARLGFSVKTIRMIRTAKHSIGTHDLTQYSFAVDRGNKKIMLLHVVPPRRNPQQHPQRSTSFGAPCLRLRLSRRDPQLG
ncbi:hypothetical protein EQM14_11475 [Caproiciproducens sp. NJN-50]|uniref:putative PEP-binding protein n=1 Tax=Acutalibacteraceae TaxID=3082771 RepID=UPI000FFE1F80|nr:hypothetical protein EQM14_11475 [Caproiciproducens sp. NJN-50]